MNVWPCNEDLNAKSRNLSDKSWPGVTEELNSGKPIEWLVNEGKLAASLEVKTEAEIAAAEEAAKAAGTRMGIRWRRCW